jgi:arylsulfatase
VTNQHDDLPREILPIPDRTPVGLTTYEVTDPDTKYPPIRPLRPPAGAHQMCMEFAYDGGAAQRTNG